MCLVYQVKTSCFFSTHHGCLTSTFNFGYLWEDYPFISVIDKHSDNGSLLITSQYETNLWLNHFEDQTVGEALLDRIVHRSHIFNLAGESMRKKRGKKIE
ncbi:ATP-binding protein [Acinetobacter baumannii]